MFPLHMLHIRTLTVHAMFQSSKSNELVKLNCIFYLRQNILQSERAGKFDVDHHFAFLTIFLKKSYDCMCIFG